MQGEPIISCYGLVVVDADTNTTDTRHCSQHTCAPVWRLKFQLGLFFAPCGILPLSKSPFLERCSSGYRKCFLSLFLPTRPGKLFVHLWTLGEIDVKTGVDVTMQRCIRWGCGNQRTRFPSLGMLIPGFQSAGFIGVIRNSRKLRQCLFGATAPGGTLLLI